MKRTFLTGFIGGITGFLLIALLFSLTGSANAWLSSLQIPFSAKSVQAEGLEVKADFVQLQGNPSGTPVGTAFSYQGQIKKDNALYSGECDMTFQLWDGDEGSGGVMLNAITLTPVNVISGLFSVDLDFGSEFFTGEYRSIVPGFRCPAGIGITYYLQSQSIRVVPYALGLRPGAIIQGGGTQPIFNVTADDLGTAIRAESYLGTAIMASSYGEDKPALRAYSISGNALQINWGGFGVEGAGVNTNTAAFIHEVTADNLCNVYWTVIDNNLINGNPNAILLVTYRDSGGQPARSPVGVSYLPVDACGTGSAGHWIIYNLSAEPEDMLVGQQFNVWTVLP
mgnify:CR=1 FL=1